MQKESGPDFLARILARKGPYEKIAESYYRTHHPTNSLYLEVTRDGRRIAFDGWDTKRGMSFEEGRLEQQELIRESFPSREWGTELARMIAFARKARREYEWNVIPCFEGYEIDPNGHDLERWVNEVVDGKTKP
ncbi:MAG: hypothetical protein KJ601_04450 [Nanoarchaeota archaeon]|nr:hypothetical protein [Nanoarchaeota archaeon]MBU1704504.1 hypothetical protein [Nanoarchaeota archaeon]